SDSSSIAGTSCCSYSWPLVGGVAVSSEGAAPAIEVSTQSTQLLHQLSQAPIGAHVNDQLAVHGAGQWLEAAFHGRGQLFKHLVEAWSWLVNDFHPGLPLQQLGEAIQ